MAASRPLKALAVAAIFFLALMIFPAVVGLATDWMWFGEVGYRRVFVTRLLVRSALFLLSGALAYFWIVGNARIARRGKSQSPILWKMGPDLPPVDIADSVGRLTRPAALFLALLFAIAGASGWMTVLRFLNATPFGVTDPVFGRDLSAYVFILPLVGGLLGVLRTLVTISLIIVLLIYLLRGKISLPPQRVSLMPPADRHVAILLVLFLVLTALQVWFVRLPGLLFSDTGPLVGASYTDLHARYPALHIIAVTAVIGALAVIYGMVRRRIAWFTALAAAAYIAVSIVVGGIYPWIVQRFFVAPTELTRESPQLRSHIIATRRAWGLDRVEVRDLSGNANLTLADVRANAATIQNVRLWERDPLLQTFGQLQEIRTYYDFVSIDDDRYVIDGRYRQVLLSPRELNSKLLPTRTFINQHLTFTHGMGLTLSPVNEVTSEGLPVLFVKDLPPATTGSLRVTRPQIYFGELTNEHVFVGTRQQEFDYPLGDGDVTTRYSGSGGVRVGSIIKRALLAIRFGALNILLSTDIRPESRVLFNREVARRAELAFPYVEFDGDPYMVIRDNGELIWILDAYTATDRYPYSQRLDDGRSYMRNSIKVVVDAYNGTITGYIADPSDPLVITYSRIFPGTLHRISEMPADIRKHIRYPHDLYRIQTILYATYHMDQPASFYHREDQWQLPTVGNSEADAPTDRFMRHLVMRLPDEARAEYIYMSPFTPRGKDNLAAWMVARNDGEEYGKLRVYRFPRQSLVYGPRQIAARIDQDTEISRQLTLWDQRGSQVIRGELLVIPVEKALLYVQPLYLRAEGGKIPELKRVVVAFQNRVVMSETLESGLAQLFSGAPPVAGGEGTTGGVADTTAAAPTVGAPAPPSAVASDIAREAQTHYERALAAQRSGNWALYGEEIRKLGESLSRLNSGRR
jgi:uncharacterized membrane protein (UPF0182 family)